VRKLRGGCFPIIVGNLAGAGAAVLRDDWPTEANSKIARWVLDYTAADQRPSFVVLADHPTSKADRLTSKPPGAAMCTTRYSHCAANAALLIAWLQQHGVDIARSTSSMRSGEGRSRSALARRPIGCGAARRKSAHLQRSAQPENRSAQPAHE
jgi:hypothetical protein